MAYSAAGAAACFKLLQTLQFDAIFVLEASVSPNIAVTAMTIFPISVPTTIEILEIFDEVNLFTSTG
jgi:hypothetical protein